LYVGWLVRASGPGAKPEKASQTFESRTAARAALFLFVARGATSDAPTAQLLAPA
jgi:hypothetical protein